MGVRTRPSPAGRPIFPVAFPDTPPPPMVSVNVPLTMPLPVSGTTSGELKSELAILSVPGRAPIAAGVNVTVTEQLAPGASVVTAQGTVTAYSTVVGAVIVELM